ncbi:hypothetical protein TanjilG_07932 [Lupinus angustifolius]|uniref:Uncharacterized protein n=1 Tax=Lupinus angustifolius TaxID=3871 RepID=A0A4P1RLJ8_LUPAN|nr:hypothetical protein TanjilG_07932 [Lupinus angustifolius]
MDAILFVGGKGLLWLVAPSHHNELSRRISFYAQKVGLTLAGLAWLLLDWLVLMLSILLNFQSHIFEVQGIPSEPNNEKKMA